MVINVNKVKTRANHFISSDEVALLWKYSQRWSIKFQMMIAFACMRGLRIGEICAINLNDFEDDFAVLNVILQKSHVKAKLPLIPELSLLVKSYVSQNFQTFKDGYLFPYYSSRKYFPYLQPKSADSLFAKMRRIIGKDYPQFLERNIYTNGYKRYRISFHSLRRFFETEIYEQGHGRKVIADIMRYSKTKTVDVYIDKYRTWKRERAILQNTLGSTIQTILNFEKGQTKLSEFN